MTGVSLERLADTLYPKPEPKNSTAYGTVEAVNADGSYQVKLNASSTTTRCAKLCDAEVADRVLVLIQANGHCAAIGRVGGSVGVTVLYDDATGTTGAVTLASSAANYDHMRIYFEKDSDTEARGSVDVFKPDGKSISTVLVNVYNGGVQFLGRVWDISGTTITGHGTEAWANCAGGITGGNTSSYSIQIYRVEAW